MDNKMAEETCQGPGKCNDQGCPNHYAASPEPIAPERHPDDIAVDRFAEAMKAKLAAAREKGRGGWDDPEQCTVEYLAELLAGHTLKANAGNFIDVANFAMMLHMRDADPAVMPRACTRRMSNASD